MHPYDPTRRESTSNCRPDQTAPPPPQTRKTEREKGRGRRAVGDQGRGLPPRGGTPKNKIRSKQTSNRIYWALHDRPNWGDLTGSLGQCPMPGSDTTHSSGFSHTIKHRLFNCSSKPPSRVGHTTTRPTPVPSICTTRGINPSTGYLWTPYRTSP